jgi:hypothetical protein
MKSAPAHSTRQCPGVLVAGCDNADTIPEAAFIAHGTRGKASRLRHQPDQSNGMGAAPVPPSPPSSVMMNQGTFVASFYYRVKKKLCKADSEPITVLIPVGDPNIAHMCDEIRQVVDH